MDKRNRPLLPLAAAGVEFCDRASGTAKVTYPVDSQWRPLAAADRPDPKR